MQRIEYISIITVIILISGFYNSDSLCQTPNHFWTEKSPMPDVRWGHSACEVNGKVFILGGNDSFTSPTIPLNTVWTYDTIMDTWITKASMDIERTGFATCVYNGKIYAIGGAQQIYGGPTLTTNSIDVYDPEKDSWSHLTDMPKSRFNHTASIVESKIYIIGGYDDASTEPFSQVDIYDLITDTWTTGASMPTPRVQLCATVLNGKIYTIGGQKGLSTKESGEKTVEVYDPATDTWTSVSDMLTKCKMMSTCTLNGKIYIFGGAEGYCTPAISAMYEYNPETDNWIYIGDMPKELAVQTSIAINDKIYISGGVNGDCSTAEILSTMYEFIPDKTTSQNQVYIKEGIYIYPNPTKDILNVEFENIDNVTVEIYNVMGGLLYCNLASSKSLTIDVSSYSYGIYLILIKQDNRNYIEKLFVR